MDYVFFAFSALCFGFALLLVLLLVTGQDKPPLWQLLIAAGAVLLYYYLDYGVFRDDLTLYYLFNLLPQGLLLVVLGFFIWRKGLK